MRACNRHIKAKTLNAFQWFIWSHALVFSDDPTVNLGPRMRKTGAQGELSTAESWQLKTNKPEHPWARGVCYCKSLRCGGCLLPQQRLTSTSTLTEHLFSAGRCPEQLYVFFHLIFTLILQGRVSPSVLHCKHQKITLPVYKGKYRRKASASSQDRKTQAGCALPPERTKKSMKYIKQWFFFFF